MSKLTLSPFLSDKGAITWNFMHSTEVKTKTKSVFAAKWGGKKPSTKSCVHFCPRCPIYLVINHVITPVLFGAVKLRMCYYDNLNTGFCNNCTHSLIHLCSLLHITDIIVNTAVSLWKIMGHYYLKVCGRPCLCLGSMCKIQVLRHFKLCYWVNRSWYFGIVKALQPFKILVTTCPMYPTRLECTETPCYENLRPCIVPYIGHHSVILWFSSRPNVETFCSYILMKYHRHRQVSWHS